jgi:hypothetical protein
VDQVEAIRIPHGERTQPLGGGINAPVVDYDYLRRRLIAQQRLKSAQ